VRRAAERIRARLAELRSREQDDELVYSLPDPWKRKLFVALCRSADATGSSRIASEDSIPNKIYMSG